MKSGEFVRLVVVVNYFIQVTDGLSLTDDEASTTTSLPSPTTALPFQNQEHVLFRSLLRSYDPTARPVKDHRHTLPVHLRLKLYQIFELSEKEQTLTTNLWIEQQWQDVHLKWNLTEHLSVRSLRMPSNRIWTPDTYIYNSASKDGVQGALVGPYAMIHHDGLVKFPVPMKLKTSCEMDITYFPFDSQICYIKFASWVYDLSAINLTMRENDASSSSNSSRQSDDVDLTSQTTGDNDFDDASIDLNDYTDNSGWMLINVSMIRREKNHSHEVYPELICFIHIKRRYMYYIFNVILPCAMLSCLTCTTFWLPCLSGEKVSLGLTCFVAYSVFMLMVAEKVPDASETIPILSIYLTIVMSLTSISIMMAVVVTNIFEKSKQYATKENRIPRVVRVFFIKYLVKCMGMEKNARQLVEILRKLQKLEAEQMANKWSSTANKWDSVGGGDSVVDERGLKSAGVWPSRVDDKSGPSGGSCLNLVEMIASDLQARESRNQANIKQHQQQQAMSRRFFCSSGPIRRSEPLSCYGGGERKRYYSKASSSGSIGNIRLDRATDDDRSGSESPVWSAKQCRKANESRLKPSSDPTGYLEIDMAELEVCEASRDYLTARQRSKTNNMTTRVYKIRPEHFSVFIAHEYVLVSHILDRFFFWLYLSLTVSSYVFTLLIVPFWTRTEKISSIHLVP